MCSTSVPAHSPVQKRKGKEKTLSDTNGVLKKGGGGGANSAGQAVWNTITNTMRTMPGVLPVPSAN